MAGFGRLAAAVEDRTYADDRLSGAVHVAVLVGGTAALGSLVARSARHRVLATLATAAATWIVLGGRSLAREAEAVAAGARVVVQDVPLLVEKGLADEVDLVLVVHAPEAERIARLVRDRAMTEADARARVAAQATDEQRRAVADLWLENTGTPADLVAAVDELWARPIVTELGRRGS